MTEVAEVDMERLHQDIIKLQRDMSVIKHILSEEDKLTPWAKNQLKKARKEPISSYTKLDDL